MAVCLTGVPGVHVPSHAMVVPRPGLSLAIILLLNMVAALVQELLLKAYLVIHRNAQVFIH